MTALPTTETYPSTWRAVFATSWRLLTFRATAAELRSFNKKHLVFGLLCTWLVGIGRYWDNPRVHLLQHLGIGSVIYVFVLSLLLWLVLWPLRPKHCTYFRVLTFVSLVSPPAILYAIPVEHFYSVDTANSLNVWFLAIVATWRVALLLFFLKRLAEMDWLKINVATLLPLTLIVVTLTILNLERVVFNLMGGLQERTANDDSYFILILLSYFAILLFVPLLVAYAIFVFQSWFGGRKKLESEKSTPEKSTNDQ